MNGAGQLTYALGEAGLSENTVDTQTPPKLVADMHGASLARFLGTDLIDVHGQQIGRSRRSWSGGLHLGNDLLELGIRGLADEQLGLAGQSGGKFASQCEPLGLGTRMEVAERTDNFLAWAFGSEDPLDEDVVGVGLAFVGARGFADVHICRHY